MKVQRFVMVSLLGAASVFAAPISLGINPAEGTVSYGKTTVVDITISGLGEMTPPSLSAWDLDLHFDPALLAVKDTQFGNELNISGLGSATSAAQSSPGDLHLYQVSFDSPNTLDTKQPGSFNLAEITMLGLQPGTSRLWLSINELGDSIGNPIMGATTSSATLKVTPRPVTATPEPSTELLLTAGSLLLLFVGRPSGLVAGLLVRRFPFSRSPRR